MSDGVEDGSRACPDDGALRGLLAGDDSAAHELDEHVANCERCSARLEELAGATEFQQRFVGLATREPHDSEVLAPLIEHLKTSPQAEVVSDDEIARRFPVGSDLDGFEIGGLIARGGMGVVLKAHDTQLARDVAIKLLDPARSGGEEAGRRFLSEARAAAAIDHDNVLPVFTTGTADGLPYLVMPFVDGETVAQRVEREGALAPSEVERIALAVARGLDAAHRAGLVHRDVKPANILLEPERGRVWIADFGLARAAEDPGFTREGFIAGTPQFMSPEQADGAEADVRSDLYSLGAVVFYMLAGRPPFKGDSSLTILRQVADSSPEWPKQTLASTPSWLARLTRQLMSKAPAGRPKSAGEVVETIESGGRRTATRRRAIGLAAAGVALAAAGGVAAVVLSDRGDEGEEDPPSPFSIAGQGYATFAQALEAAKDGDVVELAAGEFETSDWPAIDKPVVVQAKVGVDCELLRNDVAGAVLDLRADVRLEGLRVAQPLLRPGEGEHLPPLVVVGEGSKVELESCTFTRSRPGKPHGRTDGADGGPPPAVEVLPGGELVMRRCEMASAASFGVAIRDGGRAVIERCLIGCEFPFYMDGGVELEVRRSALIGISAVMARGENAGGRLVLDSNQLLAFGSVLWLKEPLESVGLEIESTGNLYAARRAFVVVGWQGAGLGAPEYFSVQTLPEWRALTGEPDGASFLMTQRGVARMMRDYSIAELHPAPDLALERVRPAVTELGVRHPNFGPASGEAGSAP